MARPLRIAHLADTHIGMENYGRINPETGLNQRLHDFLRSLDEAIDGAIQAGVDLVVFAGDIYKTRDPTPTHQREFARRIRRLSSAGVQTLIVAGNHDIPLSAGRATSVDIFRALEVPSVIVARTIGTHVIQTRNGPLQVLAFPWTVRSAVLAQPEFKNHTISELNQAMIDLNRAKLRMDAEALDASLPTMVIGHAHLFGARIGAERLLTMGNDPMYDMQTFDLPGVDFVALGHIHKHQALNYAPTVVYAGSIDRVDFGEQDENKGWVYVEIPEKGRAEWDFRKVAARPFLTIEAKVESDNATEDVVRAIVRQAGKLDNAVVKLRIDVPPERVVELREDDIRSQLKGAYFLAPFERTTRQRPRGRWGSAGTALQRAGPIEALTVYLEHQKVDADRRAVLVRHARTLMGEDESIEPPRQAESPTACIPSESARLALAEADSPDDESAARSDAGVALPS
ncbi:MAG: exonuclease SbcCD subunit D [Chloroflexota bacterium]|nr:exonuclease SbcCD subunit D [Chloroflexota bacterium]